MKARQLEKLGLTAAQAKMAKWMMIQARQQRAWDDRATRGFLMELVENPGAHVADGIFGELARTLAMAQKVAEAAETADTRPSERAEAVEWRQWGTDLEPQAVQQMVNACRLPVAVRGALMPDAHLGYGIPIGGVLATENAVIPYAVGVDIACRMKLTVLDLPPKALESQGDRLVRAIEEETRFGMGARFGPPNPKPRDLRHHPVMEEDWKVSPVTRNMQGAAHAQLGTSGSGNHFVEFGLFAPANEVEATTLGLEPGVTYLALLSHSGSRGVGSKVADHYARLAMTLHPELPKELLHLAWLDMDSDDGQEYWAAMQLMGRYAAANHELIHKHIAKHLGARVLLDVENHHNFAWEEEILSADGKRRRKAIVHRKGATPAGPGVMGIIPGSMATPGYLVRGKGSDAAMNSAAHGAGRVMSRTKARATYRWNAVKPVLEERGVRVLSAGLDEVPFVYKDIEKVMEAQSDLVEIVGRFDPKLVKMAPEGEKAED